ncbi:MAG TPA: TolC family protein [Gemmataceae bacterium]|jgi:outer membrane protein TolC|nr:TolC family protein [Gemmataceae bacterium]
MMRSRHWPAISLLVVHPIILPGCQAPAPRAAPLGERIGVITPEVAHPPQTDILPTSAVVSSPTATAAETRLPEVEELSEAFLIEQVLARNPSLAQMTAVWQAARARYPQVVSFDDPMFGFFAAPGSIGSNAVDFGYRLELSQKLPYFGKRALRGDNARAEASAACHDLEDMRLQLVESARGALAEYYLVARALAVNDEGLRLLRSFRDRAKDRYEKVPGANEQDVLQADVELGRQDQRRLTLERMQEVAVARINTLLHLPPDNPLPPPPAELPRGEPPPDAAALRTVTVARRPDLRALQDRLRADEASLALAEREYYPDFEVSSAYDTIMGNGPTRDLAPQAGVRLNVPLRRGRREGAVAEAAAKVAARRAELARLTDQVNFQVQEAHAQVRESDRIVDSYETQLLPAARANVNAAESSYIGGRIPFLSLIEAQRNVVELRDRYYEAVAELTRRRAALERATGGPVAAAVTISLP